MIILPRPINKQCKQQHHLENRNDNFHNSRADSPSAKIMQCKPGFILTSDCFGICSYNVLLDLHFTTWLALYYLTCTLLLELKSTTWLALYSWHALYYLTCNLLLGLHFTTWLTLYYLTYTLLLGLQSTTWLALYYLTFNLLLDFQSTICSDIVLVLVIHIFCDSTYTICTFSLTETAIKFKRFYLVLVMKH